MPDPEPTSPYGSTAWVRAVDVTLLLLALGYGAVTAAAIRVQPVLPEPEWLFLTDQIVGVLGCVALWWRRSRPVPLAVALAVLSAVFELVAGAMLVALFTVAAQRPISTALRMFGLSLCTAAVYISLRPEPGLSVLATLMIGAGAQGAAVGWGLFVARRRELLERTRSEAQLLAEQAEHRARVNLAREMHDVLGHRLSLLSVYAGALRYRQDAPPEEVARAAEVIRDNAHRAQQDLRDVIGVLRAPDGDFAQPSFAEISRLATESEQAGMRVELTERIDGPVPSRIGRIAYRIIQEGLTNARKHAPGAAVTVRVEGAVGDALDVEVRNDRPERPPPPSSSGQGLTGVAERVGSVDGTLRYGPLETGGWTLCASLPWRP